MTTAIAQYGLHDMTQMSEAIARSGLFGMKSWEQALALMLVAQSENQHPASITQDYDIIQGKACRKTHSVMARFQQMGGKVEWHELTDKVAEATFSHPAGGSLKLKWTIEQANAAKLTSKDNWKNYPRAMLRARLIAEGVRSVYPAAIGGMLLAEEAQDLPPPEFKEMGAAERVDTPVEPAGLPPYSSESFATNLPKWRKLIDENKKSADDIIKTVLSKATLTEEQIAQISIKTVEGEVV